MSTGGFGETRYRIDEVFELADVARIRVILPAMDVDEKERTFRLPDDVKGSLSLRVI